MTDDARSVSEAREQFDKLWPEDLLRHVVKAPSQYDSSCRAMAGEILRLRDEAVRADALRQSLADWQDRAERQYDENVSQIAKQAALEQSLAQCEQERQVFRQDFITSNAALADCQDALATAEQRAQEMREKVARLNDIYATDGIAAQAAREIENIFDNLLGSPSPTPERPHDKNV